MATLTPQFHTTDTAPQPRTRDTVRVRAITVARHRTPPIHAGVQMQANYRNRNYRVYASAPVVYSI